MPYNTIAVIEGSDSIPDPEEALREELPDDRRLVTVYPDGESRIEEDYDWDGWVEIAEITVSTGEFEEAEYFGEELGDDFRVVYEWDGPIYIEKFVEVED